MAKNFAISVAWLLFAFSPLAWTAQAQAPVNAANGDQFSRVVADIKAQMSPSGRYAEVNNLERERVDDRLAQMTAIFAKSGDVEHMDKADKIAFFNAQEEVNGILLKRDGDRLVCVTEARSGTHFKNTTCKSAREIAADRESAQNWYRNGVMHGGMQCAPGVSPGAFAMPAGAQSCPGAN